MNVFATRKLLPDTAKRLQDAGIKLTEWNEKRELSQEELIDYCKKYDALISAGKSSLDRHFFQQCSHLKVVALHAVGYDNVDLAAANEFKVPVGNTPGVVSESTADAAFLLMIAASRKAFFNHKRILNGDWNFFEPMANLGIQLEGKTLGILGLGKIGYEMAKRCTGAFDMKIIYHNRSRNELAEQQLGAVKVSFEELLAQSDVLSIHTNLTPETANKFNKETFSKMKPGALFINAARGGIHNEADLMDAINNGTIWGAGLDVTNPEPMDRNNPLLNMPTVAVLPHIGTATIETRTAMGKLIAENIIAGLTSEKLPYQVIQ